MTTERIAKHMVYGSGFTRSRAIASAVNTVKKWCATGDVTQWKGQQTINAKSRAAACNAWFQWERKKAQARATKSFHNPALQITANGVAYKDASQGVTEDDLAFIASVEGDSDFGDVVLTTSQEAELYEEIAQDSQEVDLDNIELLDEDGKEIEIEDDSAEDGSEQDDSSGEESEDQITIEDATPTEGIELSGPIVSKNESKRLVQGAVLVPGEPDSDGEILTAEKIDELARDFMENHRYMDQNHTLQDPIAVPTKSWTTDSPKVVKIAGKDQTLPPGTWEMEARITDDDAWNKVLSGELDGFSIMGVRKADYERAVAAAGKSADGTFSLELDRVLMQQLGEDFIAPAVSVVKGPAVRKGMWYAIKSAAKPASEGSGESEEIEITSESSPGLFGWMFGKQSKEETVAKLSREELQQMVRDEAGTAAKAAVADAMSSDGNGGGQGSGEGSAQGSGQGSGEGSGEGSGGNSDRIVFESQQELDDYLADFMDSYMVDDGGSGQGSGEEDDESGQGSGEDGNEPRTDEELQNSGEPDTDPEDVEDVDSEIAATKQRLSALNQRKKSNKSQQVRGQDGQRSTKSAEEQDINSYLDRDSFGRKKVS